MTNHEQQRGRRKRREEKRRRTGNCLSEEEKNDNKNIGACFTNYRRSKKLDDGTDTDGHTLDLVDC